MPEMLKKRKSCTKEYQEKERKSTQSFKKEKRIKWDIWACQSIYKVDVGNLLLVEII